MADPLLSSLCGICHIKEPKYKCPRCGARTCSLSCVKKHKNWSSCNGERDPTVYLPPSKLRTDAGIDHDYNFLTKIERTVERTEKIFTEERGILPERQTQPPPNKKHRLHKGQSRGKTAPADGSRQWARLAMKRLDSLGIRVLHVPYGMARAKENTTSYNKKTKTINWQVEWMLLDPESPTTSEAALLRETRLLNKVLDHTALYIGFADCQEGRRRLNLTPEEKEQEKRHSKKQRRNHQVDTDTRDGEGRGSGQDPDSSVWIAANSTMQDGVLGQWQIPETSQRKGLDERPEGERTKYQFYYQIPGTPSREPRKLIAVEATDALETILPGFEVLEFPTIYVLPAGLDLPPGYTVQRRVNKHPKHAGQNPVQSDAKKRKRSALVEYVYGNEEEEGEVKESRLGDQSDPDSESDDLDMHRGFPASKKGGVGDQGRLQEDNDTTSSSGSDSEMDVD